MYLKWFSVTYPKEIICILNMQIGLIQFKFYKNYFTKNR